MPQIVMQIKNEKTGRPKDAQPPTMPTQENLKIKKYYTKECPNVKKKKFKSNIVGADASVSPQDPNKYNLKTFEKFESDIVGVGVLDDPNAKNKHINKITSINQKSNIKFPTSNTAITLVALIITIIVLLILAGVTLNMVIGENGIFGKANNAKNKTEIAQYEEELRMCVLEIQTDEATKGTTFGIDTIRNNLVQKVNELQNTNDIEITTEEGNATIEGIYKGYEFTIDEKYVAHIGDKATGIRILTSIEPKGWTQGPVTITITIKSNNGIAKIKPENEEEIDVGGKTEYVITKENIEENTIYKYDITDSQGTQASKKVEINTIDKNAPANFTITAENTAEGLKITGTATDAESGIDKYEYYAKKTTDSNYTKYDSNPITGLSNGTYDIKVIAYDKAGNTKESVLNSFKVEKTIKRTNISATDIKNNPEGYYGQEVNYTSSNGQNDWKIFHSDGTNIYLITGNYVKVTNSNGNIDTNKLKAGTKMQIASGGKDYRVNWNSSNLPTFSTDVSSDIISKFKINTSVFNINDKKNNTSFPNAQCVSTLLDSSLWTEYIDSSKGSNQTAIGGPTVQLWMDSWNARYQNSSDQLYCNNSNTNGYFVGSTSKPQNSYSTSSNSKKGNGGELYFANNHSALTDGNNTVDYYWLASPSAGSSNDVLYVHYYGYVGNYGYGSGYGGLRPVVCLQSNISLK